MRHTVLVMILLMLCLGARPATAQLFPGTVVFDPSNFSQNLIQAVQSVYMVANQVLELTNIGSLVLDESFLTDVQTLGNIVQTAEGLAWDLNSIDAQFDALFDPANAPCSSTALVTWQQNKERLILQSLRYAMRLQTLLTTAVNTVTRMITLVSQIASAIGNLQISQNAAQEQAMTAGFQRAASTVLADMTSVNAAVDCINLRIMADHP